MPQLSAAAVALLFAASAAAQDRGPDGRARNPGLPGWCETPVRERKAEPGCYTTAIAELGVLPRTTLYWHLDSFPTPDAAEIGTRTISDAQFPTPYRE